MLVLKDYLNSTVMLKIRIFYKFCFNIFMFVLKDYVNPTLYCWRFLSFTNFIIIFLCWSSKIMWTKLSTIEELYLSHILFLYFYISPERLCELNSLLLKIRIFYKFYFNIFMLVFKDYVNAIICCWRSESFTNFILIFLCWSWKIM